MIAISIYNNLVLVIYKAMRNLKEGIMITDYKLVKSGVNNMIGFEQQIKDLIDIGWQPHGVLQLITIDKQPVLVQPLILASTKQHNNGDIK